MKDEIS